MLDTMALFEVDVAAGQVKKVEWKCYTGMQ